MGPFTVGQVPAQPQVFVIFDADGNQRDLTTYTNIHTNLSTPPSGAITHPGTCSVSDPTSNPGKVALLWGSLSPFPVAGTYSVQLELTGPGTIDDFTGWQDFVVEPVTGTTSIPMWATPSDVASITGKSVTDAELVVAQMVIDLVTNRTPAVSGSISSRDITWLKRALAFQAIWMKAQPDLLERSSVSNVSQDGVSATFTSKASVYLGPLAIRALKNVKWLRTRSLRVQSPFIDQDGGMSDPMIDDALWNWSYMSIVPDPGFSAPWYAR